MHDDMQAAYKHAWPLIIRRLKEVMATYTIVRRVCTIMSGVRYSGCKTFTILFQLFKCINLKNV
ncbi:hypothetical protein Hanom_Chr16g01459181 [Helianthus anomalus]